jgi:peptidoglycan/xylan/chitin deacetylase (PgdA/CDA1 family)
MRVALTFDAEHPSRAGHGAGTEEALLDTLAGAGLKGTFFLQGRWASAYPAIARRIAAEGHLIGNHSHYHAPMPLLSPEGIRVDVEEAERRITDVTGRDPKPWFRCPFGDGADRSDILAALEAIGYRDVAWNVDSNDWSEDSTAPKVKEAVVSATLGTRGTSTVLFHTWSAATAAALPSIIEELGSRGASFVTAAEVTR